jgi:hypothetical protein
MGWADKYIAELKQGKTVRFRPTGSSMQPHITSGQLVEVSPIWSLQVGDIVLCSVDEHDYLHFIKNISVNPIENVVKYQIGNAHGRINGWILHENIYGFLTWKETPSSANGRPHGSQP